MGLELVRYLLGMKSQDEGKGQREKSLGVKKALTEIQAGNSISAGKKRGEGSGRGKKRGDGRGIK